jgi:hypothetical protein
VLPVVIGIVPVMVGVVTDAAGEAVGTAVGIGAAVGSRVVLGVGVGGGACDTGLAEGDATGTTCVTGADPVKSGDVESCPNATHHVTAAIAANAQNRGKIPRTRFIPPPILPEPAAICN